MKCIVPIAGPDLWSPDFGLRPLLEVNGQPLIEWVLLNRPWAIELKRSDYVFVIRAVRDSNVLVKYFSDRWPEAHVLSLPALTDGAMLTAMAGATLCGDDEALIVDLADIGFDDCAPLAKFEEDSHLGAIVPTFESSEPIYSYLDLQDGYALGAREKVVISSHASAGVYIFRDRRVFFQAAAHSFAHRELRYNDLYYVCPMVNGVIEQGFSVHSPQVSAIAPVGKIFHRHTE